MCWVYRRKYISMSQAEEDMSVLRPYATLVLAAIDETSLSELQTSVQVHCY